VVRLVTDEQIQMRMAWHQEAWKFLRAGLTEPVEPALDDEGEPPEALEEPDGDDQG